MVTLWINVKQAFFFDDLISIVRKWAETQIVQDANDKSEWASNSVNHKQVTSVKWASGVKMIWKLIGIRRNSNDWFSLLASRTASVGSHTEMKKKTTKQTDKQPEQSSKQVFFGLKLNFGLESVVTAPLSSDCALALLRVLYFYFLDPKRLSWICS